MYIIVLLLCIYKSNSEFLNPGVNYPDVIDNKIHRNLFGGYQYPIPQFPPLFLDETTTQSYPTYGPPLDIPQFNISNDFPDYPSYLPPVSLQPPLFDSPPEDDEDTVVIPAPPSNEYLPSGPYNGVNSAQVRIFNMTCLNSPNQRYFRAIIHTPQRRDLLPVIDDAASDCVSGSGDVYRLDFHGERMKQCGVRFCASGSGTQVNMCVGIRIPTVRGLKLLEDMTVTLQCKPQERIVSHMKHLRFNAQSMQARSSPTLAKGGSQQNFETQVELFRRSNDGTNKFSRLVNPGAVVQLGEELLLRAAVRDGDGWKYSMMGEVVIQHVAKGGKAQQRSLMVVDSAGCRDTRMRSVCPDNPLQLSPLVSTLVLRAFMFQGMESGDEMVMSVRVIGCLLQEDCFKSRSCDDHRVKTRSRRSASSNITNWQSFLEFRVAIPDTGKVVPSVSHSAQTFNALLIAVVTVLLLAVLLAFLAYYKFRRSG